jgi:hypothetical protein
VRDDRLLRTEPATNRVYDYGVNQAVENLPRLGERMSEIIDQYHNVQPDVLETFIDRGPLRKLAEPTIPGGKRIPGLQLDHPRPLAVMHALVRFSPMAAGGRFTTADLYAPALDAPGLSESHYTLASFRHDLSKAARQRLGREDPALAPLCSSRQRLRDWRGLPQTVRENLGAPDGRSAGALGGDGLLAEAKRCELDRLYQRISDDLDALLRAIGLKVAA